MTVVPQGSQITLLSQWYEYGGGPSVDLLSGPTIKIVQLANNDNTVPQTTAGVNHPAVGVYTYNWTPAETQTLGDYLVVWQGIDQDSEAVQATEVITVGPSAALAGTWSTPAEASAITGQNLSQAQLDVAYHVIETFCGVVVGARPNLRPRDLRLLKKAEAYQAAWMAAQIDLTGRSDATTVSQDGLQYSKGDVDMHILGPLAAASLRRCSWMRTRSLEPLTPTQALLLRSKRTPETIGIEIGNTGLILDSEADDQIGGWVAM